MQCDTETEVGQSPQVSPRILHLREEIMRRGGAFVEDVNPLIRSVALWRAVNATDSGHTGWWAVRSHSRVQARAGYLLALVRLASVVIEPTWRLVGNHLPTAHLGMPAPDPTDADDLEHLAALDVAPEQAHTVRDDVIAWQQHDWFYEVGATDVDLGRGSSHGSEAPGIAFSGTGWSENHSIRDYAKVLHLGFAGIRAEIAALLAEAQPHDPDFPSRENFWRAGLTICDAGMLLGQRYADAAEALAAEAPSEAEAQRLRKIAATCRQVPARGARSFAEAVQALWFAHILTCGEDSINANSLGRIDQILYPYYEADLAAGRIDPDTARELMEELACRLYLEYDVQAITLGGVDRAGNDAVNDLSYLILDATRNVDFARDLSIRLHPNSPPTFVRRACELIARGGGIPFLFNDDCYIEALTQRGIALEDARDYAPIGCVELTIPGRANPRAVSGLLSSAKCLELALFDGRDPRSGEQVGPHTGDLTGFKSFEELFDAYRTQVECFAQRMVYDCNRGELAQRERGPLPCLSVLTDDCIARGRDITDGGAVYNYHSICFVGTANTADSLIALKKLIFDERTVDPALILQALRNNYEGHETLRQRLLHMPKYGNDIAEVDVLADRIAGHFIDVMDTMRSPLGGRYFVHLFSFRWNLDYGSHVGATPDGRRAGEPLAYSLSAQQGRNVAGVTALLTSLSRLPHHKAAGGSAAIVELDPNLVAGEEGIELLSQLITTAMTMGVGQLQWNVVTAERLRKAQADPERYGNIPVRVAGYSQMFRLIPKELQDHIIARTKHRQ